MESQITLLRRDGQHQIEVSDSNFDKLNTISASFASGGGTGQRIQIRTQSDNGGAKTYTVTRRSFKTRDGGTGFDFHIRQKTGKFFSWLLQKLGFQTRDERQLKQQLRHVLTQLGQSGTGTTLTASDRHIAEKSARRLNSAVISRTHRVQPSSESGACEPVNPERVTYSEAFTPSAAIAHQMRTGQLSDNSVIIINIADTLTTRADAGGNGAGSSLYSLDPKLKDLLPVLARRYPGLKIVFLTESDQNRTEAFEHIIKLNLDNVKADYRIQEKKQMSKAGQVNAALSDIPNTNTGVTERKIIYIDNSAQNVYDAEQAVTKKHGSGTRAAERSQAHQSNFTGIIVNSNFPFSEIQQPPGAEDTHRWASSPARSGTDTPDGADEEMVTAQDSAFTVNKSTASDGERKERFLAYLLTSHPAH